MTSRKIWIFAMLDETAKKLAAWVIERGDEPLVSYVVYLVRGIRE